MAEPLEPSHQKTESGHQIQAIDLNGDGRYDTIVVTHPDGTKVSYADTDFDGEVDTLAQDSDGNGAVDLTINENSDGTYTVSTEGDAEDMRVLTRAELDKAAPGAGEMLDRVMPDAGAH